MKIRSRDRLLLFTGALIVNGVIALVVNNPGGSVDANYYFNGGHFLVETGSFKVPYIWSYVNAPDVLPAPAFRYWNPGAGYLAGLGIWLFGGLQPEFGAAQMLFWILGAIVPLLAYQVGIEIGERRHGLVAGGLTIFSGFYVMYWSLPETFTPYALTGGGCLLFSLTAQHSRETWLWMVAGLCAGMAHLTRADGLLMAGMLFLVAFMPSVDPKSGYRREFGARTRHFALGITGYLVVMVPWFLRNLSLFGSVLPPGGLDALWIVEYNDLFNYPAEFTVNRFVSSGFPSIIQTRGQGLLGNLLIFIGVHNLVFLTPFTLIGIWQHWRRDWLFFPLLYGSGLYVTMSLAFPLQGVRGGFIHSGAALVPFVTVASALGLDSIVGWATDRIESWENDKSLQGFSTLMILVAAFITGFIVWRGVIGTGEAYLWNRSLDGYRQIGMFLIDRGIPETESVMVNNPPAFYTATSRGGIPLPNGDEATLLKAADDFGISYLIIDSGVGDGLINFYMDGPSSNRFVLLTEFEGSDGPVFIYRIDNP